MSFTLMHTCVFVYSENSSSCLADKIVRPYRVYDLECQTLGFKKIYYWGNKIREASLFHFRFPTFLISLIRLSDIHHPDIHHLRRSSPQTFITSDVHHPLPKIRHSSPRTFITSDIHHLRHSSPPT